MSQQPGYKIIENDPAYVAIHKRALTAITISLGLLAKVITERTGADFQSLTMQTGQEAYDQCLSMSDEEIDRIIDQILSGESHIVRINLND